MVLGTLIYQKFFFLALSTIVAKNEQLPTLFSVCIALIVVQCDVE